MELSQGLQSTGSKVAGLECTGNHSQKPIEQLDSEGGAEISIKIYMMTTTRK